jgi:hypothetical protein
MGKGLIEMFKLQFKKTVVFMDFVSLLISGKRLVKESKATILLWVSDLSDLYLKSLLNCKRR